MRTFVLFTTFVGGYLLSLTAATDANVTDINLQSVSQLPELNKKKSITTDSKISVTNITMTKPCHVIRKMIHFKKIVPATNRTTGFNKEEWMCELSTEDTIASDLSNIVKIEGLDESILKVNGAMSGYKTLFQASAVIQDDKIVFNTKQRSILIFGDISPEKKRRLAPGNTGQKSVLFVRIIAADGGPTPSLNEISNSAFGTFGDTYSFRAGFAGCSYNQLIMNPSKIAGASNGVIEISIPERAKGNSENIIWESARTILASRLGVGVRDLSTVIDHVVYCIPPGTQMTAAGVAWMPGYESWYNDKYCIDKKVIMHELGHNILLSHSMELMGEYDDSTCQMGWGGWPNCYNGAKSFQLGWYAPRTQTIDLMTTGMFSPMTFTLIGISDYQNPRNSGSAKVVLKLEAGDRDYYIAFNRKKGITAGTGEYGDEVLITKQNDGGENSVLLAHLLSTRSILLATVFISNMFYDIQITVNSINLSTDPGIASVTIARTSSKVSVSSSPAYGGTGGGEFASICPTGSRVKSFNGWSDSRTSTVGKLMMFCDNGALLGPFGFGGGTQVNGQDCSSGFSSVAVTYGTFVAKVQPICGSTSFNSIGSGTGQTATFTCPGTQKIVGIKGRSGNILDNISFLCAADVNNQFVTPLYGGSGGLSDYSVSCPSGRKIAKIDGRGGAWVDQLRAQCDDGSILGPVGGAGGSLINTVTCTGGYTGGTITYGSYVGQVTLTCSSSTARFPIGGGTLSGSGTTATFQCPAGQFVIGIRGKSGSFVDSVSFICGGSPGGGGTLGDWAVCSSSSQCANKCCSKMYSNGILKCTPLRTPFNPAANGCVSRRYLRVNETSAIDN